jgi:signal transduction histidine kinase
MEKKTESSVKEIRRRLVFVVLRALVIVVVIMVLAILSTTTYEINNKVGNNPFYRSPSTMLLEAYYLGHGSWEGVADLVRDVQNPENQFPDQDWLSSIVVDAGNVVIIDHGSTNTSLVGQTYNISPETPVIELKASGRKIGGLIKDAKEIPHPLRLTFSVINPIAQISLGVGVFAIVLGILLTQRVVNPIAEVISAAKKVSDGDLSTRIATKKGNDDLSALIDHFNTMTASLEANDNERRQLLADIAHELRTPLSVLRGRLEGIVDGVYPANDVSIAPALEETYLLERLVEDLRLLTLAETRQLHFEMKEVDLKDLFERVINVFNPQAAEKGVNFVVDIPAELPRVWVDPQRIEQVIGNIIDNALNYSTGNSRISIKAEGQDKTVRVAITDSGNGVPQEEIDRIFDRFYRSEKSRTRSKGGAGLGLAIVKQLVEAQGGKVGAENAAGGGLCTWFILPQKPVED